MSKAGQLAEKDNVLLDMFYETPFNWAAVGKFACTAF